MDVSELVPYAVGAVAVMGGALYYYAAGGNRRNGEFLCMASDLSRGEMRDFSLGNDTKRKVLLVHTESGEYHAVSPKCTHYAAPLAKGTLQGDRVLCPWHGACFNVASGDVEDAPALDALHSFKVTVDGGKVFVAGVPPSGSSAAFKRVPDMCVRNGQCGNGKETFVILGGGAAGAIAAETLRQVGFEGRIVMVCKEPHVPYDRVKLSKNLAVQASTIGLRSAAFYKKHGIELMLGTAATGVNTSSKTVSTDQGGTINYDKLLIATGGFARQITMAPGYDLDGIFTLREPEDAHGINAACEGAKTVVVVGSSFIGMEAAACLKQAKKIDRIIVVGMEKVPFERVLGSEIGAAMQAFHESKGIEFRMSSTVKEFRGNGNKVNAVQLSNDEVLECDFCVVGAGIICGTKYLEGSGINLERDGSIVVDANLRVPGCDDVYVAGDIARYPFHLANNSLIRIEHWDVAMQHGRVAAKNMAGVSDEKFVTVPFFWTAQFGKSLRYAGNCMVPSEIIIKGSLEKLEFVAYYVAEGKVTAVATMGADPVAVAASELLRQGKMPTVDSIRARDDVLFLASLTKTN